MAVTIDGTNGITSPDFEPSSSTVPTNGLFLPTTNTLGFATNSTERLRLDASGNLGIGTSSPGVKLQVDSGATGLFALFNSTNANGGYFSGTSSGTTVWDIGTAKQALNVGGSLDFGLNVRNGFMAFGTGNTERARIDSSGNFGIGTTSPVGNFNVNTTGNTQITISAGSTGLSRLVFQGQVSNNRGFIDYDNTSTVRSLIFRTNETEAMRIDSSGNLLVGTTTASARLAVVAPADVTYLQTTGSTSTCGYAKVPGNTAYYWLWQNSAGSNIAYIRTTDGTTVTYNTGSDVRLKENIVDSKSSLQKINNIKVREFSWKSTGKKVEFGFIAQELNSVAPEAVSQGKDNVDGTIDVPWGVDKSVLVPALVKAIQELNQRLEALENK